MAKTQRKYDMEYKIQAVKLAKELGGAKAAAELGMILSILAVTPVLLFQKGQLHHRRKGDFFSRPPSAKSAVSTSPQVGTRLNPCGIPVALSLPTSSFRQRHIPIEEYLLSIF